MQSSVIMHQPIVEMVVGSQQDENTITWVKDIGADKIIHLGKYFESVWQQSRADFIHIPNFFLNHIPLPDKQYLNAVMQKRKQEDSTTKIYEYMYRGITNKGETKWLLDRCYQVYEDQTMIAFAGFCKDITSDKHLLLHYLPRLRSDLSLKDTTPKETTLTNRELECLYYYVRGCTAKEIAQQLSLSHKTVENHIAHVKQKLNLYTRADITKAIFHSKYFYIFQEGL